jgi:diadenosine tetraphosphatase ApaH/serine/threonine PP2A family protein phosphatase
MKIAVLSDVHGNLTALEAVLAEARRLGAGEVWSLGDAVGYGPRPKECLDLLAGEASLQIMGNHDAAAAELTSVAYFNENARRAVEWTQTVLAEADIEALARLPYTVRSGDCLLVHSSPDDPPAWHYITGPSRARLQFESYAERICFAGHTHAPFIADDGPGERGPTEEGGAVCLEEGRRYFVNAGSVGQPRDRDPRASWVLFDRKARSLEIRRTPYDIEAVQGRMRAFDLPSFLVDRLSQGV